MSIELGYWGIRGLGAPLRMMLTYAGVRMLVTVVELIQESMTVARTLP